MGQALSKVGGERLTWVITSAFGLLIFCSLIVVESAIVNVDSGSNE